MGRDWTAPAHAPRLDGAATDAADAGAPICPAGQNKCAGATFCTAETGKACGPSCVSCPAPTNGVPTCTSGACGEECRIDGGFSYVCATDCCPAVNEYIQYITDVSEVAMAMDASGKAHLAWASDNRVWYAEQGPSGWRYRSVDRQAGPYAGLSMVLDATGRPHLAYSRQGDSMRYARLDNNAWTTTVIDPAGGTTRRSRSLARIPASSIRRRRMGAAPRELRRCCLDTRGRDPNGREGPRPVPRRRQHRGLAVCIRERRHERARVRDPRGELDVRSDWRVGDQRRHAVAGARRRRRTARRLLRQHRSPPVRRARRGRLDRERARPAGERALLRAAARQHGRPGGELHDRRLDGRERGLRQTDGRAAGRGGVGTRF